MTKFSRVRKSHRITFNTKIIIPVAYSILDWKKNQIISLPAYPNKKRLPSKVTENITMFFGHFFGRNGLKRSTLEGIVYGKIYRQPSKMLKNKLRIRKRREVILIETLFYTLGVLSCVIFFSLPASIYEWLRFFFFESKLVVYYYFFCTKSHEKNGPK